MSSMRCAGPMALVPGFAERYCEGGRCRRCAQPGYAAGILIVCQLGCGIVVPRRGRLRLQLRILLRWLHGVSVWSRVCIVGLVERILLWGRLALRRVSVWILGHLDVVFFKKGAGECMRVVDFQHATATRKSFVDLSGTRIIREVRGSKEKGAVACFSASVAEVGSTCWERI